MGSTDVKGLDYNTRDNLVRIYKWIEENKHKSRDGVTTPMMFAHVVKRRSGEFYPPSYELRKNDVLYNQFLQQAARYRRQGYLILEPLSAGTKPVYRVNEKYLPAGTVTYTGVRYSPIQDVAQATKAPKVMLALLEEEKQKLKAEAMEQGRTQVLAELGTVMVESATLKSGFGGVDLHNVSLHTLLMAGRSLQLDADQQSARISAAMGEEQPELAAPAEDEEAPDGSPY